MRTSSDPAVRILGEPGALDPNNAKPLPCGGLHYYPTLQTVDHRSTQLFQAGHFSRNVIGLNIQVNPALVINPLNFNNGLVLRRFQHTVVAATARVIQVDRATQRLSPEAGSLVNIGGIAIDEQRTKSGMVHGFSRQLMEIWCDA
jgi:hypothetical protein